MPILLTRYGIAPEKAFLARPGKPPVTKPAPKAETSVGDPSPVIGLGKTSEAHYTVRSLRGGYVYVYYEISKSWEAYAVDSEGRFAQVSLDNYVPAQTKPFDSSCTTNMQKVANASLITIQDPKTAGKVWFGFSDAWWTAAIRKDNESEGVRKLHMRCVDVQGWYNENKPAKLPKYTASVANVEAVVADYAMTGDDARHMFWWSPFPGLRQKQIELPRSGTLKSECQRLLPDKGLIVVLDDPVAILQELSAYIDKRWNHFLSQKDGNDPLHPDKTWRRKSALSSSLETLKLHVEREAEASVYAAAKDLHEDVEYIDGGDGKRVYNTALLLPGYRKMAQPILDEKVSKVELEKARVERWGAHAALFDPKQRKDFEKRFSDASALHDANYTTPLANAHAAWLKSANLHAVLDHHFDMQDINSGIAFAGVTLACMAGTGGLGACMQVYSEWFDQPFEKSPLWRGLLLNHHPLIQAVDSASSGASAPFTNPDDWINLVTAYGAALGKIKQGGEQIGAQARVPGVRANAIASMDVLPALLQELGDATPKWMVKGGKKALALLATLGMRSEQQVRWVQVVGTRRDLYTAILELSLESQKGRGISLGHLQYSVADQLRTFEIEGVKLDEEMRFWTVVFDTEAQHAVAKQGVTSAQRATGLGKAVKVVTVSEFKESTLAKTIEFATHSGVLAGVGLGLTMWGLNYAGSADSAMKHVQGRTAQKIVALYSAGMGSVLDLVRVGAKAAVSRRIPMLSPWLGARLGEKGFAIWEGLGQIGGGAGMIILGVIDFENFLESFKRRQAGMATLYIVNSAAEVYVGGYSVLAGLNLIFRFGLVFAEFNPVILGLTAAILVVSVIIEIEKDPPTMDWVRQCLWGKENNYRDEAEETDNFNKALTA
ncbi:hypothetical protein BYI23_C000120 [Burkholderia sp. YI23]|nr:hypothetical protein BYI23_C000120 [Burkholderia sp. YI23]